MTQQAQIEQSKPPTPKRKEYISGIPTVKESQLWPRVKASGKKHQLALDIMAKSYIIAVTGARGGIKSGTLAYLCIHAMAKGYRAISNLPVKCHFEHDDGRLELLETEPLDIETLIMNPQTLDGSLIAWDEYQQHDRSGSHMSTQHQLLIGEWEQIRKQEITFAYVSKRINLIPGDIAWETDLELNCQDISRPGIDAEGTRCVWEIKDLSGYWSRHMFNPLFPVTHRMGFYHRAIWGSYDTRQRFDPLEAKRGFQLDLQKRVITDKDKDIGVSEEEYSFYLSQARTLLKDGKPMRKAYLFSLLGVDNNKLKNYLLRRMYGDMGLREYMSAGSPMVKQGVYSEPVAVSIT